LLTSVLVRSDAIGAIGPSGWRNERRAQEGHGPRVLAGVRVHRLWHLNGNSHQNGDQQNNHHVHLAQASACRHGINALGQGVNLLLAQGGHTVFGQQAAHAHGF